MSTSPTSQRNGDIVPGMTNGMPRKRIGSQPRCRNNTAPTRAAGDNSLALSADRTSVGSVTAYVLVYCGLLDAGSSHGEKSVRH
jgi:hypothetical protein